jgi:hypothetical protein
MLTYISVPNEKGVATHVKLRDALALNTEDGTLFHPHSCIGEFPTVCRTGPIYDESNLQCEKGIITSNVELHEQCEVQLIIHNQTEIQELSPGQYVILTTGEKIRQQCTGQKEIQSTLLAGVYFLTVKAQCIYRAEDWTIEGFKTYSSNVTIARTDPTFLPLNLNLSMFSESHFRSDLMYRPWMKLKELRKLALTPIPEQTIVAGPMWNTTTTHRTLLTVSLLCSGMLMAGVLVYLAKRRGWCQLPIRTPAIVIDSPPRPILPEVAIAYSRLKEVTRRREMSHALQPDGLANPKDGDAVAEVSSSSSP